MIVAGFGCRNGAGEESLRAALAAHHQPIDAIATLAGKDAQIAPIAHALDLPLILIDSEAVKDIATPTQSSASIAAHGVGSVAEAVAIAAAGPGARIIAPRIVSPDSMATCAIAQGFSA